MHGLEAEHDSQVATEILRVIVHTVVASPCEVSSPSVRWGVSLGTILTDSVAGCVSACLACTIGVRMKCVGCHVNQGLPVCVT